MAGAGRNAEKEEAIARHLLAEHAAGTPYTTLTGDLALADMEEAYRTQQAFIEARRKATGAGIAGYKIALTSKAMQDFVGVGHPLLGAIFDDTVHPAPAEISLSDFQRVGVEFELALRLGRDVPLAASPYDAEAMAPFVAEIIPAFELVEDRNAVYENFDALSLVADNAWSAGVVLGEAVADWGGLDLAALPAHLEETAGRESATTGAALGNPLTALAWAANELGAQGRPLSKGMIVMTGSTMKTRFPAPGERYVYEIEGVGTVRLSIRP